MLPFSWVLGCASLAPHQLTGTHSPVPSAFSLFPLLTLLQPASPHTHAFFWNVCLIHVRLKVTRDRRAGLGGSPGLVCTSSVACICVCVCMHVCTSGCAYMYVCICVDVPAGRHTCAHAPVHAVCVHMYTRTYVHRVFLPVCINRVNRGESPDLLDTSQNPGPIPRQATILGTALGWSPWEKLLDFGAKERRNEIAARFVACYLFLLKINDTVERFHSILLKQYPLHGSQEVGGLRAREGGALWGPRAPGALCFQPRPSIK